MKINFELLSAICETPGAPGYEQRIRKQVIEEVTPLVDSVEVDNMGNIYAVKKGTATEQKSVMLAAHIDEIGFIVSHIDDNGFVRFHPLGGFDPKTLTSMRVLVHGKKDLVGIMGVKPIHMMSPEERQKSPKLTDYFIDLGLPKLEVEKFVSVGDTVTRKQDLIELGDCITGKSLDNRISVFILIEVLRNLKKVPYDVHAVFTVQEEVGIRGAQVASHLINPDFGIALDVTIANDTPGASAHEKITEIGKGCAIKIMDSKTICDYRMVDFLKSTADRASIAWQPEILPVGGTDTAQVQRMGKHGSIAGAVSTPVRYIHQTTEMANPDDIHASIELITAALETLDKYNWEH
jgi:putative aminopeptidase FrvX